MGFDDEHSPSSDVGNTEQLSGLAYSGGTKNPPPDSPEILFVLASYKTFEVDTPNDIPRLHEIESVKRNSNSSRPTFFRNPRIGCPDAIPTGVSVPTIASLFFRN